MQIAIERVKLVQSVRFSLMCMPPEKLELPVPAASEGGILGRTFKCADLPNLSQAIRENMFDSGHRSPGHRFFSAHRLKNSLQRPVLLLKSSHSCVPVPFSYSKPFLNLTSSILFNLLQKTLASASISVAPVDALILQFPLHV